MSVIDAIRRAAVGRLGGQPPARFNARTVALEAKVGETAAQVARLTAEVAALQRALPPSGWAASNYTCLKAPRFYIARNGVTGLWSVWDNSLCGAALSSGLTPEAAIAGMPPTVRP